MADEQRDDMPEQTPDEAPEETSDAAELTVGLPGDPAGAPELATSEPLSEDDLERLFAEQDAAAPGGGLTPAAAEALGTWLDVLRPFASQAAEVLGVGIDSIAGKETSLGDVTIDVTEPDAVAQRLTRSLGLGLRVQLTEMESQPLAAFVDLEGLGALLSLDTDPERLSDESFGAAQLETISTAVRELLDLVSLTLFSDGLSGAEVVLAEQHIGDPAATLEAVVDAAGGAPLIAVDLALSFAAAAAAVTVVVPVTLLERIAEALAPEDLATPGESPRPLDVPAAERTPASLSRVAADDGPRGFGLTDDPDDYLSKISPIRPEAGNGRRAGEDVEVHSVRFPSFPDSGPRADSPRSLDLIMDVQMRVTVELGRSTMTVEDVLSLGPGSVVELNKLAGEPVDILVNDRLIARGEVVVVDENFGVRVTEIASPRRRAHAMGR